MVAAAKIPDGLASAIHEARLSLSKNESLVERASRYRVLRAMGPSELEPSAFRAVVTVGMRRRIELYSRCTQFVLPLWESLVGTRHPHRMIEIAHQQIDGGISREEAASEMNSFLGAIDNFSPPSNGHVAGVGYVAAACVTLARKDVQFGKEDETSSDEELDCWDGSVYACAAFSGGLPWLPESDPGKAHEFWTWWIDDAVPSAYLSVPDIE
jgi:hypothetical protein